LSSRHPHHPDLHSFPYTTLFRSRFNATISFHIRTRCFHSWKALGPTGFIVGATHTERRLSNRRSMRTRCSPLAYSRFWRLRINTLTLRKDPSRVPLHECRRSAATVGAAHRADARTSETQSRRLAHGRWAVSARHLIDFLRKRVLPCRHLGRRLRNVLQHAQRDG